MGLWSRIFLIVGILGGILVAFYFGIFASGGFELIYSDGDPGGDVEFSQEDDVVVVKVLNLYNTDRLFILTGEGELATKSGGGEAVWEQTERLAGDQLEISVGGMDRSSVSISVYAVSDDGEKATQIGTFTASAGNNASKTLAG
jgi:hypothetical protein